MFGRSLAKDCLICSPAKRNRSFDTTSDNEPLYESPEISTETLCKELSRGPSRGSTDRDMTITRFTMVNWWVLSFFSQTNFFSSHKLVQGTGSVHFVRVLVIDCYNNRTELPSLTVRLVLWSALFSTHQVLKFRPRSTNLEVQIQKFRFKSSGSKVQSKRKCLKMKMP